MLSQKFGLYKEYYLSRTKTSQGWVKANVFFVGFQPQFFQPSLACVLLFCSFRSRLVLSLPHKYSSFSTALGVDVFGVKNQRDRYTNFGHGNTPYKRICPPVPSDLATLVDWHCRWPQRIVPSARFCLCLEAGTTVGLAATMYYFLDGLKQIPRKLCFCLCYPFAFLC